MTRRIRLVAVCCCLVLAAVAGWRFFLAPGRQARPPQKGTAVPGTQFTAELDPRLYDCTLTLTAQSPLPAGSAVRLLLEANPAREATEITISGQAIQVTSVRQGRRTACGRAALTPSPTVPTHLTIQRRGQQLGIFNGETLLFAGTVPPARGTQATIAAGKGWTADVTVEGREPVIFADDFMRASEEEGGWRAQRGQWRLQSTWDNDPHGNTQRFSNVSFAQNAFAWVGTAATGSALCTAGQRNWDDYTLSAAVYPGIQGAVGLAVNLTDAQNGYLVRWSPANDRTAQGNRLALLRLEHGSTRLLAESAGGYVPGQWYRMAVESSLEGLRVRIDGRERLAVTKVSPLRGMIGLYAEGAAGVTFDDVSAYGSTVNTDLLAEAEQTKIANGFRDDVKGMKQWVETPADWVEADNGLRVNRHDFYGDHWMVLKVTPTGPDGQLILRLNGDEYDTTSGQRAEVAASATTGKVTYTLYHDARMLAKTTGNALRNWEEYTFRFRATGSRLVLQRDGATMLQAEDTASPRVHRPAYLVRDSLANVQEVLVLGRQYRDYTFATAPVDWLGEGTWMATMRWACQPKWSFYSGWSRGDAVLWQKHRLTGDQSLQAYMAFKMEYPREHFNYDQRTRYHDACLTICGDGSNPRSGYTLVSGLADAYGTPNARTVLYRNGVAVQESGTSIAGWGQNHFSWYDMELRKRGATVEFLLAGTPVISYTDPHPLAGGVPAIWTTDNGISIARARIHCANPLEVRTDAQVYLDTPWFPEWTSLHTPLPLEFPQAFATTGTPVRLQVTQLLAPTGEGLPTVAGRRVIFLPERAGDHWYQIRATDGTHASPAFNLFLPVFDPGLGRDDSHAVLVYRFDEGAGSMVHDRSAVRPRADLHIPAGSSVRWLPGQGLTFRGPQALATSEGTGKLMVLKVHGAGTIEAWISTDSCYPKTHWLGSVLTWAKNGGRRNIQLGMHMNTFIVTPPGGKFQRGPTIDNFPNLKGSLTVPNFRTGLLHMVITWDGSTTRVYANGVELGQGQIPWQTDRWIKDAPLLLGNQADGERNYLGTYYLIAFHDRCFSPAQVERHYQAGPGAK